MLLVLLAVWPLWFGVGGALGVYRFSGVDFKAYYLAGVRVRDGLPLYGTAAVEAVSKPRATRFLYPPIVALPFVPLTFLSPLAGRILFLVVQFAFLWSAVIVLLRAWDVSLSRGDVFVVGWLLAGVQPVVFLLRVGNVTGFLAGSLCLSAAVTVGPAVRSRPYGGGALATLACLPKPYVAPAGAHLLGDWRRLLGAGIVGIGLTFSGFILFGPSTTWAYVDTLLAGNAWRVPRPPAPLPWHYRPFAWFHRFPPWRAVLRAVVLGVAVLTALVAERDDRELAFAMGCVTVPLAAPSADTLTLLVAVPGLLVAGIHEYRRNGALVVVLASAVCVQTTVYFARALHVYGPRYLPAFPWDVVRRFVVLQPGTVGLLAVFGLCVTRIWDSLDWRSTV